MFDNIKKRVQTQTARMATDFVSSWKNVPVVGSTVKEYYFAFDDFVSDWVDVDPDEAYVFVETPVPPKKANALPETKFMSPTLRKAFERLANNK